MKELAINAEQEGFEAFRSGQQNRPQAVWLARTRFPQVILQEAFLAGWTRARWELANSALQGVQARLTKKDELRRKRP